MMVLSSATQRTAIHEARLMMRSLALLGDWGASFSSMGSRGCEAFVLAFSGPVFAVRDGVGEDLVVVAVGSSTVSFFDSSILFMGICSAKRKSLEPYTHCQVNLKILLNSFLFFIQNVTAIRYFKQGKKPLAGFGLGS